MTPEEKWATLHAYRTAVAHGDAPEIKCPDCDTPVVPVVGRRDEPALKCFSCRTVFGIGAHVWDQIGENIHDVLEQMKKDGRL